MSKINTELNKKLLFISILTFNVMMVMAQNFSGFISDCKTKESLIGANVINLNNTAQIASTNTQGYFSLAANQSDTIMVSYIGYSPKNIIVANGNNKICLDLGVELIEVTILSQSNLKRLIKNIDVLSISPYKAKLLPSFLGEPDILKAFMIKPGVISGNEGSSGLFIRGGSPDQNLMLLDDNPIYNSGHLFGFVSFINPDVVKKVELHKGYFPAKYGGRLSSIIDIQTNDGNKTETNSEASIGIISSRLSFQAPIIKDKTSFTFNARASYLGLLLLKQRSNFNRGRANEYDNYWLYDINAKIHHKIDDKNQLYLSVHNGIDKWDMFARDGANIQNLAYSWGSSTISLRHISILTDKLVLTNSVGVNRYSSSLNTFGNVTSDKPDNSIINGVNGINMNSNFEHRLSNRLNLNYGFEFKVEDSNSGLLIDSIGVKSSLFSDDSPINTIAFYGTSEHVIGKFGLKLGMRANTLQSNSFGTRYIFEPRLQTSYKLSEKSIIRLSYNHMHQPLSLMANNGLSLPVDQWLPSNSFIPISQSKMIGLGYSFANTKITYTLDGYLKRISDISVLKPGSEFFNQRIPIQSKIVSGLTGQVFGIEQGLEIVLPKGELSLAYTFSKNSRRSQFLNDGKSFPFEFDRPHQFNATIIRELPRSWTFASTFTYSSGRVFSIPDGFALQIDDRLDGTFFDPVPFYNSYNNGRFPSVHRLDISFTKKYDRSSLSLGIFNVYGRFNPYYLELEAKNERNIALPSSPDQQQFRTIVRKQGLIPFIPSISYTYVFK